MPNVLILEDNPAIMLGVGETIAARFPELRQMRARNIAEAQSLLSEFAIDLFLLDIELPDGNGIDFLCDVRTVFPNAAAIIMTATPLPGYRAHAEQLGVVRFLEKPFDLDKLADLIRATLGLDGWGETPESRFKAALSGLTTMDIIQLKCLGGATQVLRFSIPDGPWGKLHFRRGEIVHGETSDGLVGADALNMIVRWKGGRVEESAETVASVTTIQQDWQSALLEAVRLMDESEIPS